MQRMRMDMALAERARLRQEIAEMRRQMAEAQGRLAAERDKTSQAEGRAGNYWRMFGQAQQQLHDLRAAVIDSGGNPDEMIRRRRARLGKRSDHAAKP